MNEKKVLLSVSLIFGLLVFIMTYSHHRIILQGLGLIIDRQQALGVVNNEYGIRDLDLETINNTHFAEPTKKLLIRYAQDIQSIMLYSNDNEWIKQNAYPFVVRLYCALEESKGTEIVSSIVNTTERRTLVYEFWFNYGKLNENKSPPSDEDMKTYCFNHQ